MYIFREHTKIRKYIYFPLLSHVFSPPKHQAPSKVANTHQKKERTAKKRIDEEVY